MSNITIDFNYFQARTWPPRWYIYGAQCGAQNKVSTLSWSSETEKSNFGSYICLSGIYRVLKEIQCQKEENTENPSESLRSLVATIQRGKRRLSIGE